MTPVEFWFDFRSPYSYLAATQLGMIEAEIRFRPMQVLEVMKRVGNAPTTIQSAAKGRYARTDLQRWAALYGVGLAPHPNMRAIDADRLLTAALAADRAGLAARAVPALFNAFWRDQTPLDTEADVRAVLQRAGAAVEVFDGAELRTALAAASQEAAEKGVFGAPTFIAGDAMFFGNDRLSFLRDHLKQKAEAA